MRAMSNIFAIAIIPVIAHLVPRSVTDPFGNFLDGMALDQLPEALGTGEASAG